MTDDDTEMQAEDSGGVQPHTWKVWLEGESSYRDIRNYRICGNCSGVRFAQVVNKFYADQAQHLACVGRKGFSNGEWSVIIQVKVESDGEMGGFARRFGTHLLWEPQYRDLDYKYLRGAHISLVVPDGVLIRGNECFTQEQLRDPDFDSDVEPEIETDNQTPTAP